MKTFTDCMIDFETLGLGPASAVTQLGYVFFNREELHGFNEGDNFIPTNYKIDIGTQLANKRQVLPSTWEWCQKQPNFIDMLSGTINVAEAVTGFKEDWSIYADKDTKLWSNGPNFDEPILTSLCNQYGIDLFWKFYNSCCFRTIQVMYPDVERVRPNNAHNALSDAIAQAKTVQKIFANHKDTSEKAWQYDDLNK